MSIQPAYIAPLLVEQPTWGGSYIAGAKHLLDPELQAKKIGQAFELAENSMLWVTPPNQPTPDRIPFAIASATDLDHPQWLNQQPLIKLQDWIVEDAAGVLGQTAAQQLKNTMKVLIKFTQALNNSYQVHVIPGQEFAHWQAKPESWYFLAPGKATLGLAPDCDVAAYQARCHAIDLHAQAICQDIQNGHLTVAEGRLQLQAFINEQHPRFFINSVNPKAGDVIDLSQGGIHHSWEVGPEAPEGNIVYEVQVDVRDENCSMRAFDQGNIKDNGTIRPIHIDDYFKALNTDPAANRPEQYLTHITAQEAGESTLFATPYYSTNLISVKPGSLATFITESFHHLFAEKGEITVQSAQGTWGIPEGWSLFLPAATGSYTLHSAQFARVLQTFI